MTETVDLVGDLRRRGAETTGVEVKSARRGVPRSVRETLSALSNGRGGVIILGLSEDLGFSPVEDFDAQAIRDGVAGMAANDLTPPVRGLIEIEEVDGARVVRVDVPELDVLEKPCFVTTQGEYGGSYVRSGDGDRRLTRYEVTQLLANRGQPRVDLEVVSEAEPSDLDERMVAQLLGRVRERQPRAFADVTDQDALERLGVLRSDEGSPQPTAAGLLCLGRYPQQHFPQLNVTFVALPGLVMGQTSSSGQRFLDNVTCDGPLPSVVEQAVRAVERNMTRSAVIRGAGRTDRYEYPLDVVRELIVNAVMHRDYSALARGTQVQVELYPDRLVVRSPGGLFGTVDPAQFGAPDVTSSRNAVLARLLSEIALPGTSNPVCENRGSGIPAVMASLKAAGMSPPEFDVSFSRVEVVVPHHALLDESTLSWLAALGQSGLTDGQAMALAMMHTGREVSNETLRGWGMHRADATEALANLVQRRLIERSGGRRYATYHLVEPTSQPQPTLDLVVAHRNDFEVTDPQAWSALEAMRGRETSTTKQVQAALGISYTDALGRINRLIDSGFLQPTAPPTSRKRAYRIVSSDPGPVAGQ